MNFIKIFTVLCLVSLAFGCKVSVTERTVADSVFFSESRPPLHFKFDNRFKYYGSTSRTVYGEYVEARNLKPYYRNESYYYCSCDDNMKVEQFVVIEILTWSTTTTWSGLPSSGRKIEKIGNDKYKCTYHLIDTERSARHTQFVESKGMIVPERAFVKLLLRNVEPSLNQKVQIVYAEDADGDSFKSIDWDKYKINYGKTKRQACEIMDERFAESIYAYDE